MGVSHIHHNRDLLKDCHARGGGGARAPGAPLVPPPMYLYILLPRVYIILYYIFLLLLMHVPILTEGILCLPTIQLLVPPPLPTTQMHSHTHRNSCG